MNDNKPKKSAIPYKLILIVMIMGAFAGVFFRAVTQPKSNDITQNARDIPVFSLPSPVKEGEFLTSDDIKKNTPTLVNIWASWCVPCRNEHPFLTELSKKYNVPIFGINYKDKIENARNFLETHGNPFTKVGTDVEGMTTLNWGIRGVPETFVINKQGKIIYKHLGEIDKKALSTLLDQLKEAGLNISDTKEK